MYKRKSTSWNAAGTWLRCDNLESHPVKVCDLQEVLRCNESQYFMIYEREPDPTVRSEDIITMEQYTNQHAPRESLTSNQTSHVEKTHSDSDSDSDVDSVDSDDSNGFKRAQELIEDFKMMEQFELRNVTTTNENCLRIFSGGD